jgi:putative selenate reductase
MESDSSLAVAAGDASVRRPVVTSPGEEGRPGLPGANDSAPLGGIGARIRLREDSDPLASLRPIPFDQLLRRAFGELERKESVFDLPQRHFFGGNPGVDFSVRIQGRRVSSPLGPAAGPHTQLAQNLVLGWLGGARCFELKTVRAKLPVENPHPFVDVGSVGYSDDWGGELDLPESLEEYVKGKMAIRILAESGRIPISAGYRDLRFDIGLGGTLEEIRSAPVDRLLRALLDARRAIDALRLLARRGLPSELSHLADLDFETRIVRGVILGALPNARPEELGQIVRHLQEELGLDCTVRIGPELLGPERLRALLHDRLGFTAVEPADEGFSAPLGWEHADEIVEIGRDGARRLGLAFGLKLTNPLAVRNQRSPLPAPGRLLYLSGPPLHVLAIDLLRLVRDRFGGALPISFSAGVDRGSFPDVVALGLVPVTVSTDWLKPGGYGRIASFHEELRRRMDEVGAREIDLFVLRAFGQGEAALDALGVVEGDPDRALLARVARSGGAAPGGLSRQLLDRWVIETARRNVECYADRIERDPSRWSREQIDHPAARLPRKLGLLDCINCDRCIPICPNDAIFRLRLGKTDLGSLRVRFEEGRWSTDRSESLRPGRDHQIAIFADACNECGNCEVFCPEEGAPFVVKARFHGSPDGFEAATGDGFFVEGDRESFRARGRLGGRRYEVDVDGTRLVFRGSGFDVSFDEGDPVGTLVGDSATEIDLGPARLIAGLGRAVLDPGEPSWIEAQSRGDTGHDESREKESGS